jgi:hypothetical protein
VSLKNGDKVYDLICKIKSREYALLFVSREKNTAAIFELGLTKNDAIEWIIKNLHYYHCQEGPLTDQNLSQGEVYVFKCYYACASKNLYIKLKVDKGIVKIISFHFDD